MRTIALALFLGFAGCATFSSSGSGDPNTQITVPVSSAPPAEKAESARPEAPGFGYIWVDGYWDYLDGTYVWRDGRWVKGKPDYEYVRARYEYNGKSWIFHRPHWKRRPHATATAQPVPPPRS